MIGLDEAGHQDLRAEVLDRGVRGRGPALSEGMTANDATGVGVHRDRAQQRRGGIHMVKIEAP